MVVSFAKNKRRKPIPDLRLWLHDEKLYQLLPYFSKAVIVQTLFFAPMILYKKRRDDLERHLRLCYNLEKAGGSL